MLKAALLSLSLLSLVEGFSYRGRISLPAGGSLQGRCLRQPRGRQVYANVGVEELPPVVEVVEDVVHHTKLVIRRMTLRDVAAVFHIGESTFTSSRYPQLYRTWSQYEVTDTLATDPELCFVAEEVPDVPPKRGRKPKIEPKRDPNAKIVGFVLGTITEKRKRHLSCGYLSWVAVEEGHQRQGVGTKLVHAVEDLLNKDDIHMVIADTPEANTAAKNFLQKLGYGHPVNHVYMSLNMARSDEVLRTRPKKNGNKEDQKPVKIRQMTIEDLASVYELGEQIFTAEQHPNLYRIWSEAEVVELFGGDGDNCFVAEVDKTFAGFVLGTTIEKRHSSWKYGYLLWLGVSPQAQRFGVGRRLLKSFVEVMMHKSCRLLLCDTQADNHAARKFFERNFFSNVENHVYYSKTLRSVVPGGSRSKVVKPLGTAGPIRRPRVPAPPKIPQDELEEQAV